jgi:hypothetical protein
MVRQSKAVSASDARPYSGSIRVNDPATDTFTIKTNLTYEQSLTSDGSGVLSFRVRTSDVTSAYDWSDFIASYQEYRVLGFEVMWAPKYNQTYTSTVVPGAGAVATTHVTGAAAPTSINEVASYDTFRLAYSGKPIKVTWRARGFEELQWLKVTSPTDAGGVVGFLNGLSNDTLYGRLITVFLVEFRGRN